MLPSGSLHCIVNCGAFKQRELRLRQLAQVSWKGKEGNRAAIAQNCQPVVVVGQLQFRVLFPQGLEQLGQSAVAWFRGDLAAIEVIQRVELPWGEWSRRDGGSSGRQPPKRLLRPLGQLIEITPLPLDQLSEPIGDGEELNPQFLGPQG